jgi:hypothetical protein
MNNMGLYIARNVPNGEYLWSRDKGGGGCCGAGADILVLAQNSASANHEIRLLIEEGMEPEWDCTIEHIGVADPSMGEKSKILLSQVETCI